MLELDVIAAVASDDAIENGVWLHLLTPGDVDSGGQQPIYRDKATRDPADPLKTIPPKEASRVRVRSVRCKAYVGHREQVQREAQNKARKAKGDAALREMQVAETFKQGRRRDFAILVSGFENVTKGHDGVQVVPEEDLMAMADAPTYQWMVEQVFACAQNDAKYGDVGNAEAAPL